jgi:HPt (histidine-containing phosphotransfer) domain-containing protein
MTINELNERTLDLSYLYRLADGDEEFVRELVGVFLSETPQSLTELEIAYAEEDWTAAQRTMHSMRPSFEAIGFQALADRSLLIENGLKSGLPPVLELGTWLTEAKDCVEIMRAKFPQA